MCLHIYNDTRYVQNWPSLSQGPGSDTDMQNKIFLYCVKHNKKNVIFDWSNMILFNIASNECIADKNITNAFQSR